MHASFHVYVDPIHGDDTLAGTLNPKGDNISAGPRPLQNHPALAFPGMLQHAPYTFRTIKKAVEYVETWPTKDSSTGQSLPYTNTGFGSDPNRVVDFVVIHLMPGLYGPRKASFPPQTEEYDGESGLPWNGEVFPIELPPRVSLQGTSALDTIIDARGYADIAFENRSIFSFGEHVRDAQGAAKTAAGEGYALTFIDSLTIRGAFWTEHAPLIGAQPPDDFPNGEHGVAVAIRGPLGIAPTISNCFLVGNQIAVGLFDPSASFEAGGHHAPRIVGNTFVWNNIGLYSRYRMGGVGTSRPLILNNLFDPVLHKLPPFYADLPPEWVASIYGGPDSLNSCFEGIDASDLIAFAPGCSDPTTGLALSHPFNAYITQLANIGVASAQWPALPRSGSSSIPPPTPVVDLWAAGISSNSSKISDRADLYIRDAIVSNGAPFVARHDFRLAPAVKAMQSSSTFPNPLVNMGISLRGGPIEFHQWNQSGTPTTVTINTPPGAPDDDLAQFNCWDWDCEGFGNPRETARTNLLTSDRSDLHFPRPFECAGVVDLGADEMGELIISGYLENTRIFSRPHFNVASGGAVQTFQLRDASRIFFFNMVDPAQPTTPVLYVAPQFNLRHDDRAFTTPTTVSSAPFGQSGQPIGAEWYAQLGPSHNPFVVPGIDPALPFAFTGGQFEPFGGTATLRTMRFELVRTGPITTRYPPFGRSRVADTGPHLLEDILLSPVAASRRVDYAEYDFVCPGINIADRQHDIFQANPWFNMADNSSIPASDDNRFFYTFPANNRHLRQGTLNPPLTMFEDPIQSPGSGLVESFLFRNPAHSLFFWNAPNFTYNVAGLNGMSAGDPDWFAAIFGMATDRSWYAVRVNMELFDPDNPLWGQLFGDPVNNLQTFLVVDAWPFQALQSESQNAAPAVRATETNCRERAAEMLDLGTNLRRQR